MNNDKSKSIDRVVSTIEKQFGKGSIMRLGKANATTPDVISSGALSLDIALGIGGYPRGRIIEIYGPENSGKTTLALTAIAEAQKAGGTAAFVDAEHALDITYARNLGIRTEDLLISQPDTGEQALEIVETLVCSNTLDILVVDSVAALNPRAEIEGDMGDSHINLQDLLMSQALRKLIGATNRSKTTVIFTTGGNTLKFYSSIRLDIRRIGVIKVGDEITGNRTAVKVVKNKMAPPFAKIEFDIMYGKGISAEGDILDLGVKHKIVDKSGAWFSYDGKGLGQGWDNSKTFLKENPKMLAEIREKVCVIKGISKQFNSQNVQRLRKKNN